MNSRLATAVGLRLMGVWLILESIMFLLYSLFGPAGPFASVPLGAHRRYFDAAGSVVPELSLHDTFYMALHFTPFLIGIVPGFLTGCILLICSKLLAKLLARNLQDF